MTDLATSIRRAKDESRRLASLDTETKDRALEAMAAALASRKEEVIEANRKDIETNPDVQGALLKRLTLNPDKVDAMVAGIRSVRTLKDPVGETMSALEMDDGLTLYQVRCPIGMIGVIFESRPEVVPQILALCVKSGNGVVFKGGREALESNRCIFRILMDAVRDIIPTEAFVMLETREDVDSILKLTDCIDLLIPRGSNAFVRYIQQNTAIPVLGHSAGICHVYVDSKADMAKAYKVVLDSKLDYPAACNAAETLLVDASIAEGFLPEMDRL
ncbi:MAG: glutamate-5-semialdehyde dehydrogenase, partial [Candidatus Methanomethylophilaceae archaeon]|nr:glutamate-5-semialdehyde dehydrogenase [Candidatus Methanomethylophilaceae archaeon]